MRKACRIEERWIGECKVLENRIHLIIWTNPLDSVSEAVKGLKGEKPWGKGNEYLGLKGFCEGFFKSLIIMSDHIAKFETYVL